MYYFGVIAPVTPGTDGEVANNYIQKLELTSDAEKKYPLVLLTLMKRHAEDLIWANNIKLGGQILKFISRITDGRTDASKIRKGQSLHWSMRSKRILLHTVQKLRGKSL